MTSVLTAFLRSSRIGRMPLQSPEYQAGVVDGSPCSTMGQWMGLSMGPLSAE